METGIVTIEPEKPLWDFSFTTTSNYFFDYATNTTVPYQFKDIVITNKGNIKISAIEKSEAVNYADFVLNDVSGLTLEDNRFGIGSTWRNYEFTTFTYVINPDIFYVIEDTDGNYYKLLFTRMLCIEASCAGERRYPEFTYELLK